VRQPAWQNTLYHGDNLAILREHVPAESVDLIYLDPPFNSGREYALLVSPPNGRAPRARVTAFEDAWRWDDAADAAYAEISARAPANVATLIAALCATLDRNDLTAYLVMMTIRLVELRRVLKASGSIYLHCDPAASHYLKIVMDALFGSAQFRREIIWRGGWVSGFKAAAKNWVRNHDVLLYYVKDRRYFTFNKQYASHPEGYRRRGGGGNPAGRAYDDVWTDVYSPWIMSYSREKLGYLTQKPLALLERIILASSNPGDLVLDPFAGCGTTLHAAQQLDRRWLGIEIADPAIAVMRNRLEAAFPGVAFGLQGAPVRPLASQRPARRQAKREQAAGGR
jgi:DNA modification methylase